MLNLMFITNNVEIAKICDGIIDRIFVDLEYLGKDERQKNMDTVKSKHSLQDIVNIKNVLRKSDVLVRVNPLNENSRLEIDAAIKNGADLIMLPMFRTVSDVKQFVDLVNGRVKTILLLETIDAEKNLDEILQVNGIDEIHIGLNDLHLEKKKKFMFELLTDGTVESIINKIKKTSITYGFGGIGKLESGMIDAKNILIEHFRLNTSMVILSRSFCDVRTHTIDDIRQIIPEEVAKIRKLEQNSNVYSSEEYKKNTEILKKSILQIMEGL